MTQPARVSVIVPVRNRRQLLRRLLDGLAVQTYPDFEVIVVDDGSTDGSAEEGRVDAARGRPVRVVQGPAAGAVQARAAGVAVATGEILAFTDSDCVPRPDWLERGVAAVEAGAGVVQGRTVPSRPMGPLERAMNVDRDDGIFATCNVFYRRGAYEAAGGFDLAAGQAMGFRPGAQARGLGFGEDTLLGWRVRRAEGGAYAPEAVVEHHVFPPDISEALRRAAMTGGFPALVRRVPELREHTLVHRTFLGTARVPLYSAAVAGLVGRRRTAAALAGWWGWQHYRRLRRVAPRPAALRSLPAVLARDLVLAGALVAGSVRTRTIVL